MKRVRMIMLAVSCSFLLVCNKEWETDRENVQSAESFPNAGFQVKLQQSQGIFYYNPEKAVLKMAYAMLPTENENDSFWKAYEVLTAEQKEEFWKVLLILSRTNLYKSWIDEKYPEKLDFPVDKLAITNEISGKKAKDALSAQEKTQGIIICFDNETKYLPYFFLSAGENRDGKKCEADKIDENYLSLRKMKKQEFLRKLEMDFAVNAMQFELQRDDAMYVKKMEISGKEISVTDFQETFQIPSPHFWVEEQGEMVLLTAKGMGHGYGMSISYALTLAKTNKNHEEILQYFFDNMQLERKYGV